MCAHPQPLWLTLPHNQGSRRVLRHLPSPWPPKHSSSKAVCFGDFKAVVESGTASQGLAQCPRCPVWGLAGRAASANTMTAFNSASCRLCLLVGGLHVPPIDLFVRGKKYGAWSKRWRRVTCWDGELLPGGGWIWGWEAQWPWGSHSRGVRLQFGLFPRDLMYFLHGTCPPAQLSVFAGSACGDACKKKPYMRGDRDLGPQGLFGGKGESNSTHTSLPRR